MDMWVYPEKSLPRWAGEHFQDVTRPVVAQCALNSVSMLVRFVG